MSVFASILKKLRQERGYTQDELASILNVSRSRIGMYETGNREPDFDTLQSIAELFEVDIGYLLGNSPSPTVPAAEPGPASDEAIKFALFGDGPVTDAQFEEVKQFARFIKERDAHGKD